MIGLASILCLGIAAQWLAWRLKLPSILLLLLVGFAAGPFTGLLKPDEIMGGALLPFVALSVAVILLEGGLSLRFRDLSGVGGAVRNLILIGSPLTWGLATLAAHYVLGFAWPLASLLGAILIVTGPTVIIPLLRHVRPSGSVGSVVRWEGIVGDPIGAIAAVLVYEVIAGGSASGWVGLAKALVAGFGAGGLAALLILFLLRRNLVPDYLQSALTLAVGLVAFVAADSMVHESGLLAVTLLGVLLANQRWVVVEHIVEFKENLRVLLISSLFILLAARLSIEDFLAFELSDVLFVASLILVVRPVAVFASMMRSSLSLRERAFVAWMAPRGIVAAAVASVFSLDLAAEGVEDADRLVTVVFAVIVITVTVYGLTAGPVARRLGLAVANPQGVLFVGAHSWAREIALALQAEGIDSLLVDTNHVEAQKARLAGLRSHYGSALSEHFEESVRLDRLGFLVALTHNDEVNSLACVRYAAVFGRAATFQLTPDAEASDGEKETLPKHLRGRGLFSSECSYWDLEFRFRHGGTIKRTRFGEQFGVAEYRAQYDREDAPAIPLFLLREGRLRVIGAGEELDVLDGDILISLVSESDSGSQTP